MLHLEPTFQADARDPQTGERLATMGHQPESVCREALAKRLQNDVEMNLKLAKELDLNTE